MSDRTDNRTAGAVPQSGGEFQPGQGRVSVHQHLDTDALSALIDDRLDGDLRMAAERHVAACDDCRQELTELRATVDLLHSLPQYRPRRSFTLGPEFAHPVRTSRLARLLPILPTLRAAAAACLLLLVVVIAGDVLTQIGDESGNQNSPSSLQENAGDTAAFRGDDGQAGANAQAGGGTGDAGAPAGDGTGGQSTADTAQASNEEAGPTAASGADMSAASDERAAETGAESEPNAAAPAPAAPADSGEERAASGEDETLGETAGDADMAADSDAETGNVSSNSAASDDADDAAPAGSSSSNAGQSSAGMPPQNADDAAAEYQAGAVPTIGISTEPVATESTDAIAQAETTGPVADAQRANGDAEPGQSNWRLIEITLGVLLAVLGGLVLFLHRLRDRARRTGFVR